MGDCWCAGDTPPCSGDIMDCMCGGDVCSMGDGWCAGDKLPCSGDICTMFGFIAMEEPDMFCIFGDSRCCGDIASPNPSMLGDTAWLGVGEVCAKF